MTRPLAGRRDSAFQGHEGKQTVVFGLKEVLVHGRHGTLPSSGMRCALRFCILSQAERKERDSHTETGAFPCFSLPLLAALEVPAE